MFQSGPTDLRHFDPTLTCIPPTLSDLITTERSLHVEDFDYVAPEDLSAVKKYRNCPDTLLAVEVERTTTVEVTGGAGLGGSGCPSSSAPVKQDNTTDEEKAFIRNKTSTTKAGSGLSVPGRGLEGQFVEGRLDKSGTPFVSEVLVVADVNPQS